jgi:hypothetical protein
MLDKRLIEYASGRLSAKDLNVSYLDDIIVLSMRNWVMKWLYNHPMMLNDQFVDKCARVIIQIESERQKKSSSSWGRIVASMNKVVGKKDYTDEEYREDIMRELMRLYEADHHK